MSSILRSVLPRVTGQQFSRKNLLNMANRTPFRRTLAMGISMTVGMGVGALAFSEPKTRSKSKSVPLGDQDHGEVEWTRWNIAPLNKKDTKMINKWICKIAPRRDIFKNLNYIIPLFLKKCDQGKEAMSANQFFRWIEFHTDQNISDENKEIWLRAFDLNSNTLISLNEFISVYVLIQTMEKKTLKKRDLFKWTKANFKAIDIDGSGYLDFEEVLYWIEFAIRAGYIDNKHSSGAVLSSEELADLTLQKYDDNFDGKISFEEFRSMFNDLLMGQFTKYDDPSARLTN